MTKKLSFEMRGNQKKWPIFALGFVSGWQEFVLMLWFIEFRIKWGY